MDFPITTRFARILFTTKKRQALFYERASGSTTFTK
jgi:hypothetical protein